MPVAPLDGPLVLIVDDREDNRGAYATFLRFNQP